MTGRAAPGRAERIPFPLVAASALVAAGLGYVQLFRDRPFGTTVAVVLGSAAVGTLLAVLLVQPRTDHAEPPAPDHSPSGPGGGDNGGGRGGAKTETETARPKSAQAPPETALLVLPVGLPAGGAPPAGQWWGRDAPPPAAAPTATTTPARPAPRDLGELRDSARVVQCPRCGAFRLDVRHAGAGYAFRCRVDGHEWTWQPGTAWPVTVIASRRRNTH